MLIFYNIKRLNQKKKKHKTQVLYDYNINDEIRKTKKLMTKMLFE